MTSRSLSPEGRLWLIKGRFASDGDARMGLLIGPVARAPRRRGGGVGRGRLKVWEKGGE